MLILHHWDNNDKAYPYLNKKKNTNSKPQNYKNGKIYKTSLEINFNKDF